MLYWSQVKKNIKQIKNKVNNMYAEITKELFRKLVNKDTKAHLVNEFFAHIDTVYLVSNVLIMKRDHYIAEYNQYFIRDINA